MTSPLSVSLICPFRIMFMASYPLIVRLAVLNDPNRAGSSRGDTLVRSARLKLGRHIPLRSPS